MKIKKNILVGASVLLISALLILSSGVSMANTVDNNLKEATATMDSAEMEYPVKVDFKKVVNKGGSTKGSLCYATNLHNDPNDNLVEFNSDTPGTLNHIADVMSADFLAGGCFVGDTWWACEYSAAANSNVWTIDETNGAMNLIGSAGVSLNGLAYDNATDTLYGCGSSDLFTINQANGDSSPVGPFNTSGLMIGIACDYDGKMYGEDLGTDSLYEIDTATGEATLIGLLGIDINYAQDIAYDKDKDILYSTGYKGSGFGGGALGTLDLNDGHYTKIGDFPIGALGVPSEVAGFGIPYGLENEPPTAPEIDGPPQGPAGEELCWTFHSDDINGNNIKYIIDWGDESSEETDCYPPCTPVEVCHTYAKQGKYVITAKAQECPDGLESEENTFQVSIPRARAVDYTLLIRLFERFPNAFLILRALLEI